jgi:PAS domain S-box-containing protein
MTAPDLIDDGHFALARAVLHAALDCAITIDDHGVVVDFNPAAERTFGYAAADAIGKEMGELIVPPSLREQHRRGLRRYLDTGEARVLNRRIEITGMRSDGSEFPVELTITRADIPSQRLFVGYLRDITERVDADRELRESRARIVAAADESRRRLERDLHDGAQQQLVGLALTLRLAKDRAHTDPGASEALLREAAADLEQATADLRDLARGIHPAVLTEGGLRPALRSLCTRASLPVDLDLDRLPEHRLPSPVEATAYFVVSEGLTNVVRSSGASSASVTLSCDAASADSRLLVEVRDDGLGGADPSAGSGLRGLADRIGALDGTLTITSPPGGGTTLLADLPCASS